MVRCKKHKPKVVSLHGHHRSPEGDCRSCVYFSRKNCRSHGTAGEISSIIA